jgi:hypothetical protein
LGESDGGGSAWFRNGAGETRAWVGVFNDGSGGLTITEGSQDVVFITSGIAGGYAEFRDKAGNERVEIGVGTDGRGGIWVEGNTVADYAEVFELASREGVSPGTVLSLTGSSARVGPSRRAYDSAVVGVVCGAGDLHPGLVLGARSDGSTDLPVALSGQVYVRISLEGGAIEPGDLLVASGTPGVAMRLAAPELALGTVLGKALERYSGNGGEPEGLVRMLVMMR